MIIRIRIDDGAARDNRERLIGVIHSVQEIGGRVEYMADKFRDCFCFNCENAVADKNICDADFPLLCNESCIAVPLCGCCKLWKRRERADDGR